MKQYTLRQPRDPQEQLYSIGYIRNLTWQLLGAWQFWGYSLNHWLWCPTRPNGFKIGMYTFIISYDTRLQSCTDFRYNNINCCGILPCYSMCPIMTWLCFPTFVLRLGLGSVYTRSCAVSCTQLMLSAQLFQHSAFTQLQNTAQLYSFLCLSCVPCNFCAPFSLRTVLESGPNFTAKPTCVCPVVGPWALLRQVSRIAATLSPAAIILYTSCTLALAVLIS